MGAVGFTFSNQDIVIVNCEFIDNYGVNNAGGVRFFDGNMNIEIIFRENESLFSGGGLALYYNNFNFKILSTIFEGNVLLTG